MSKPHITVTCSWCDRDFEVSVWVGLFAPSWLAPKHCNRICERNEKEAKLLAKAFGNYFLRQIKGAYLGNSITVQRVRRNFDKMIDWSDCPLPYLGYRQRKKVSSSCEKLLDDALITQASSEQLS